MVTYPTPPSAARAPSRSTYPSGGNGRASHSARSARNSSARHSVAAEPFDRPGTPAGTRFSRTHSGSVSFDVRRIAIASSVVTHVLSPVSGACASSATFSGPTWGGCPMVPFAHTPSGTPPDLDQMSHVLAHTPGTAAASL